jgi:hypothetical protein
LKPYGEWVDYIFPYYYYWMELSASFSASFTPDERASSIHYLQERRLIPRASGYSGGRGILRPPDKRLRSGCNHSVTQTGRKKGEEKMKSREEGKGTD